ncbi:MAG: radical SAM protein, partial [Planctomycetota bacterium]
MTRTQTGNSIGGVLERLHLDANRGRWQERLHEVTAADVEAALASRPGSYHLGKLLALVSPMAENYLEAMARMSRQLTNQRFGRTIKLYAPLYLSSFCINRCRYCGFNMDGTFERVRLTIDEAMAEADLLAREGFRDILLVSSEDRDFVTVPYLTDLTGRLRDRFSFVGVEIYQMSASQYVELFEAGVEGVTLYQETYDRNAYACYHLGGPKADYDARLRAPDDMAA